MTTTSTRPHAANAPLALSPDRAKRVIAVMRAELPKAAARLAEQRQEPLDVSTALERCAGEARG